MKRFYRSVEVLVVEEGHAIGLDGKPVRTPRGRRLALPSAALAEAVAAEWLAQADTIRPKEMTLTAIANTAIDRVAADKDGAVALLMRYAETDLLCHRAEGPADLVARQHAAWQPPLDWLEARFGAALAVTAGVIPVAQPAASLTALEHALESQDAFRLAALSTAVAATGSLVLGLALAENRLSAEEVFALAQLEETYQNEKWGEDAEAAARREGLRTDVEAAALLLRLHPG
jgi:chaperone required for assembly of F1-ATPase